ncbi:MAG: hypothetical protein ABIJ18_01040 [archaeon]
MGSEKDNPIKIFINYRFRHNGYIDINNLFKEIPKWFNGFEYDFWEKGLGQKDIGIGKEYASDWTASREVNNYIQFKIDVKLFIKNINKVEVNDEKRFRAEAEVYFSSEMQKNYRGTFPKNKFGEILRHIYERYIRYHELVEYEDKLAAECVDLLNLIKGNFE